MRRERSFPRLGENGRRCRKIERTEYARQRERIRLADMDDPSLGGPASTINIPLPPELRRRDLERAETNLRPDQTLIIDAKTVVALFGAELLAALQTRNSTANP